MTSVLVTGGTGRLGRAVLTTEARPTGEITWDDYRNGA